MSLSVAATVALAQACAPAVAPVTLLALAHAESGLEPLAINVNGGASPPRAANVGDAVKRARSLIAQGYSIDLGIAQINSHNLAALGISVEDAFDPCRNLAAAAQVLAADYQAAARTYQGQTALGVAFSLYNTGNGRRGFGNGYVARVYRSALLTAGRDAASPAPPLRQAADPGPASQSTLAVQTETPPWDVFAVAKGSPLLLFGRSEP